MTFGEAQREIAQLRRELDAARSEAAVLRLALEQRPAGVGDKGEFYASIWESTITKLLAEHNIGAGLLVERVALRDLVTDLAKRAAHPDVMTAIVELLEALEADDCITGRIITREANLRRVVAELGGFAL